MARITLSGPCSYTGYGYAATRANPVIDVADEEAASLVERGIFTYAEPPSPASGTDPPKGSGPLEAVEVMTLGQLRAHAKRMGIRGAGSMKRPALLAAIEAVEAEAEAVRNG